VAATAVARAMVEAGHRDETGHFVVESDAIARGADGLAR